MLPFWIQLLMEEFNFLYFFFLIVWKICLLKKLSTNNEKDNSKIIIYHLTNHPLIFVKCSIFIFFLVYTSDVMMLSYCLRSTKEIFHDGCFHSSSELLHLSISGINLWVSLALLRKKSENRKKQGHHWSTSLPKLFNSSELHV